MFIGPQSRVTELERKALAIKSMQLRPHVLYNHLALRIAVGQMQDIVLPSPGEIATLVASLHKRLADRARYVNDDAVEEASKPSDVANVRDVAMAPEHEAANLLREDGAGTASIDACVASLDPVGVFVQAKDPLTGSAFDSILAMSQSAKTPDESLELDLQCENDIDVDEEEKK